MKPYKINIPEGTYFEKILDTYFPCCALWNPCSYHHLWEKKQETGLVNEFLNKIVKVKLRDGDTCIGKLTAVEDEFLVITHEDGLRSVIRYSCVSQIAEL